MKKVIIVLSFLILTLSVKSQGKNKIEFRGLYAGAQTISTIKVKERFYHSVYAIGLAGVKKWTFNTQFIVPVLPSNRPLIKFGLDYKLF